MAEGAGHAVKAAKEQADVQLRAQLSRAPSEPELDGQVPAEAVSSIELPSALARMGDSSRASALTSLQRAAGNGAVDWLVSESAHSQAQPRFNLSVQRAVAFAPAIALTDKDYDAIAEQVHKAIEGLGTDEQAVYSALEKLGKDQTGIDKLKQVYKTKYRVDLEDDIRGDFSGRELQLALELINIKDDKKKSDLVGTVPATDAEYKTAADKLYGAMKGMGTNTEILDGVLMPFNRDKAKLDRLKDVYKNQEPGGGLTGKGLEADINDEWGLSKNELSYALYLLNAPPPGTLHTSATVSTAGPEGFADAVPGGAVSAHTGAKFRVGGTDVPDGFSIGYEGGLASESHWLQFIWREIIVTDAAGADSSLNDSITTSSKTPYNLTTDPGSPNYNTDSKQAGGNPFYESSFSTNRTAEATTMFDYPAPMNHLVNREFAKGATKVISRAHFNTFLIRDYKTLERVSVDVEWVFNGPIAGGSPPAPRTQTVSGGAADKLPSDMKDVLVAQYPHFSYIQ
jgi:hypothetical protein